MSLIIKGMEMPNENEILVFDTWNGKMYARCTANTGNKRYEVVPLPEKHGRLIDADAVHSPEDLNNEPTIVPAEGGGEE